MSDDRKDLPPVNSPNFNERVRETISIALGKRGDKLDRHLTVRDLVDAGLATLRAGYLAGSISGTPLGGPGTPAGTVATAYEIDLTPPPTPTGFTATGLISSLILECGAPVYKQGHGHAKTVVYGATYTTGLLPTFANAVKITEFGGTVFSHPTNPATTWHLWAKWQSVDGVLSVSPAGGTNGVVAITGQDVALLLQALTGQITSAQLFAALGARINLIDGPATLPNSMAQTAEFLRSYSNLSSTTFRQGTAPTRRGLDPKTSAVVALQLGDIWTNTSDGNKQFQWTGSAWVYSPDSAIAAVDARVTSVETTKIGYCTIAGVASDQTTKQTCEAAAGVWSVGLPLATAVKQVSITSGGSTASLEQKFIAQANADTGLFAQYTVKIDNAGLISGFGLASTANNAAPSSAFGVRANQFYIAPPAVASPTAPTLNLYNGYVWLDTSVSPNVTRYRNGAAWDLVSPVLPFIVQTTPTTINGVSVPAGVYIQDAYIANGTITNAKIGAAAIDDAKIGSVSAGKITTGVLLVGTTVSSANYISGSQGWAINGQGQAEFSGVVVRGTIFASAGTFAGSLSAATGTFTGALSAATGTFAGSLSAAGGTFAGNLSAASGTFNGGVKSPNYTGYAWPASGGGFYIGPEGLLLGNYNTGAYVQFSADGQMFLGNASGAALAFNGTELTLNNYSLGAMTASIPGGNMAGSGPAGFNLYGARSVQVSGGRPPYTYSWFSQRFNQPYGYVIGDLMVSDPIGNSVNVYGVGGAPVGAIFQVPNHCRLMCIVADSNGRLAFASIDVNFDHAAYTAAPDTSGGDN